MHTPIFFHADNMDYVLNSLNEERYSADYLQNMEDLIVRQTQLLMGLPSH
jgi:hypothetical protein